MYSDTSLVAGYVDMSFDKTLPSASFLRVLRHFGLLWVFSVVFCRWLIGESATCHLAAAATESTRTFLALPLCSSPFLGSSQRLRLCFPRVNICRRVSPLIVEIAYVDCVISHRTGNSGNSTATRNPTSRSPHRQHRVTIPQPFDCRIID